MLFIQGDVRAAYTRELASLMRSAAILTVPKITLVTGNTAGHAYFALVIYLVLIVICRIKSDISSMT